MSDLDLQNTERLMSELHNLQDQFVNEQQTGGKRKKSSKKGSKIMRAFSMISSMISLFGFPIPISLTGSELSVKASYKCSLTNFFIK